MNYLKIILVNSILFFFSGIHGQVLIRDLNPGIGNAVADNGTKFKQLGEKIFFIASEDGTKSGLYVVNNNIVELVREVCSSCAKTSQLFIQNEKLYFSTKENGKHKIFETNGEINNLKLVVEYGNILYDSYIFPTENKIYFYEYNVGIHLLENGTSKIIPNTRFLDIRDDNSRDKNRVVEDDNNLIMITKISSDSMAILKISDNVETLSKIKVDFGSDSQHGLKKVNNGYIFIYDGDLFNYKFTTKKITKLNLNGLAGIGSILTVIDFKPNQPMLYVYNNGIFVINNTADVTVTKISTIWDSVVQGTEFQKAYHAGRMLLLTQDYNTSFSAYALLSNGAINGTYPNKIKTYPSSLVQSGRHVFFAAGITNGFNPSIYYFDFDKNAPVEIKAFTESSNNLTSIMPIGLIGSKLYYLSNLDPKYGRELYYIETGILTNTEDIGINKNDYFTLNSNGNNFSINTKNQNQESLEITIFDTNGRVIKSVTQNSGESFDIPNIHQLIFISVKSGLNNNQGVFKTFIY